MPFLFSQAETAQVAEATESLGLAGYVVFGAYLVLLLVLGYFGWRKSSGGEEDYYLAGREQGWIVSSITIMATFFSSFALLGVPGMMYREGVVYALIALNVPIGALIVALLGSRIAVIGRRFGYVTPGDMVSDYYGSRFALRLLVALAGFLYAVPYVVMQMQAGGIISQKLFGEEYFALGATLLAVITTVYIMIGGMRSVAWTDVIQGVLLISGMFVCGWAMFIVFDGPVAFSRHVMEDLPDSSLTAPGNSGTWTWTMVLSVCVLLAAGSMIQPAQWMRYYAARSPRTLYRGAVIFATVLTASYLGGVMLIGIAGQVLYPLTFYHEVEIVDGPQALQSEVPDQFADSFRFVPQHDDQPARVIWQWQGRNRPEFDNAARQTLTTLSDHPKYASAVQQLQRTTGQKDARPQVAPHPQVDPSTEDGAQFDSILVVVLRQQLPEVLGAFGAIFASIMIVSIMAASMSTADSNLHALSAVITRDLYDQFVRPQATSTERVWVGRLIIVATSLLALLIVILGRSESVASQFNFLNMIALLALVAVAFSVQVLPIAVDILLVRRGTRAGAVCGLITGLVATFLFGPLFGILIDVTGKPVALTSLDAAIATVRDSVKVDRATWGLMLNILVFVVVSRFTRPVNEEQKRRFSA